MPLPIITTLGDATVADMLERAREDSVRDRQIKAARRVDIIEDDWADHGKMYVRQLYREEDVRDRVCSFWSASPCVATALLDIVCVAYQTPPVRRLRDAPEDAQAAFSELLKESKIRTKAKGWERYTKGCNVVITVPVVRKGDRGLELCYERFLPHHTEVITDPSDPMGRPEVLIASYTDGSEWGEETRTVIIDRKSWRYFDADGRLVKQVDHNAGVFPGTVWRLADPIDDWWSSSVGSGVFDLTLKVAHKNARKDWVRFGQDRKKEMLVSKRIKQIGTQVAGAEGPVDIPLEPSEFKYWVEDVNTPITNHRDDILFDFREGARLWSIPPDMIDMREGAEGLEPTVNAQQQSRIATTRDAHIEWYREAEHDSAWKTALVVQGMRIGGRRHRLAERLKPDVVFNTFEIAYPKLTFVEHPEVKVRVLQGEVDLGTKSTFGCYEELNPGSTRAQAKEAVLQVALDEAELEQIYITHNLPRRGHDRRQTIAEVQGALGGMHSGETRKAQADERKPGRADASSADRGAPA